MARKKSKKTGPGAPAWMTTYSDLVTLLLTFFVLLLSMAKMDQIRFQTAIGSLRGAFGVMDSSDVTSMGEPKIVQFTPIDDDFASRLYSRIQTDLVRLQLDKKIFLVQDKGTVVLRIRDSILFDSGQIEVRPEAYSVLRKVAELVRPLPFQLRIEGHTDDTPVSSTAGKGSNWDISMRRALSVLKFLAQEDQLPLDRLAAVGYGATRPVAENDTPENRRLNRRVDFVLENLAGHAEDLPYLIDAREQMPF